MIVTDPSDIQTLVEFTNSGEGLYTSTFSATTVPGSYNFIIKALKIDKESSGDEYGIFEFYRESQHSVFVSSVAEYSPVSELLFNIQLAILQLPDDAFKPKSDKRKNAFMNKLTVVGKMINEGNYEEAARKLEKDILSKMDGKPKNDWIIDDKAQDEVYTIVVELIDLLQTQLGKHEISTNETSIPEHFDIYQNYPNPFNPNTVIKYQLPEPSRVYLEIYNIIGSKVATLVDENQGAGYYEVHWNAANYSSGIYICRIRAGEYIALMKLLLLK